MQNHIQAHFTHPQTGIPSLVYWSVAPTRRCVLFVHGFGGKTVDTWDEFDRRLPPRCADDILFFGYDGLFRHATESAADFQEVIRRLAQTPSWVFEHSVTPPQPPRASDFTYDRIVVVAHSLGAVVVRRALLDAYHSGATWLERVRLVLFAPAHIGTRAGALITAAVGGLTIPGMSLISTIGTGVFRAFQDLLPGSSTLTELRSDMLAVPPKDRTPLAAHTVVWAESDPVVINGVFPGDPALPQHRFKRLGWFRHNAVCKPVGRFLDPLYIAMRAARR